MTDGRAAGVTLTSGEELQARTVVSNADPRRTLLGLIDPVELEPGFLARIRNYRATGTVAKINLALERASRIHRRGRGPSRARQASFTSVPSSTISSARSTRRNTATWSPHPYLEITIPSLTDPTLAPAGAHVMSITAQFAPYRLRGTDWATAAPAFADAVIDDACGIRTGSERR